MTSPNHRLYSNEGHNVNVTKSVPSMSSINLTYRGTSSSHRHYQVVSCHLWDVFPFLLEGYTQLDIVHRMWMSATNRLIKDVPSVSYWGQIQGICWKIKHTDVFCRNSLHTSAVCNCRAEKWSIQVTNNGMQLCAMSMGYAHPNQHASPPPPPPPSTTTPRVPPCVRYDGDVSIPLPWAAPCTDTAHLLCEAGNVTEEDIPPWTSCQIRKIVGCACTGNAGNVFPRHRLQRKP